MPLLTNLAIGAAVLAVLAASPLALPAHSHVQRTRIVAASASSIFTLINSNHGFQRFNPYLDSDPDLQITLSGPQTGPGSHFTFSGREGTGTQVITSMQTDRQVVMQIDMGARGRPVQTFDLIPVAGGTEIRWTVDTDLGLNPIARVVGLFLDGMLAPKIERGLDNISTIAAPAA